MSRLHSMGSMGHWCYIGSGSGAGMRASWSADLGRVARQRRVDLGWSQEELAGKSEVTRQWLTRFETGKGDPTLSKALRVLRELKLLVDVSPEERVAAERPQVTIPTYEPIGMDVFDRRAALERSAHAASHMEEPHEKALSSASTEMHTAMAGALERLSRSQQEMRGRGQLASDPVPAPGDDREDRR
ncbi:helix-turn-helix transcriptional regulator [Clavibacter tessellarius]|uniref:helix-turn-helix transcriptional regulator n=1 Tax=Clavibacter tessellarius TaxID=31965 RepID=UPI0039E99C40